MKVKIEREPFIKGLAAVSGIINIKTTLPILSNVLLESKGFSSLVLTSTDMEIGVSKQVKAEILEEGSITIPVKKILDITRELASEWVEFKVTKANTLELQAGKSFIKLIGLPKDDFPVFPMFDEANGIKIQTEMLQECLRLTSFAISTDENKYVLNGMLMKLKDGLLEVVATDGRRLAYIKRKIEIKEKRDIQLIIPIKTIHELQRLQPEDVEDIQIITLKNQVVFKVKDGFIISRLIDGHFPDYEKVIPSSAKLSTLVARAPFLSVLRRAFLLTSKEAQGVKLDFLKDKILISAKSPNLGELKEEIEVDQKTEGVTIGFNPAFLIDVLKNLEDENVKIEINEEDRPGVIRRNDGDYLCVVMPMQIH